MIKKEPLVLKKRIAVSRFDSAFGAEVGSGISEMLITALHKTGRFLVVERIRLDEIMKEQDLGKAGRISRETRARIGGLLGAQILVVGAVTQFSKKERGKLIGIGTERFTGGLGLVEASVACDIRLCDVDSGLVIGSHRASATIRKAAIAGGAEIGRVKIGMAGFGKTPLGEATSAMVDNAVSWIAKELSKIPWEGRVIKAEDEKVYINGGRELGMRDGIVLDVIRLGDALIDPETGLSLGYEETEIGRVEVVEVRKKYSIGKPLFGKRILSGDVVRVSSH
jgi:curli biogenesis system outer membrane secretion channel CsgG